MCAPLAKAIDAPPGRTKPSTAGTSPIAEMAAIAARVEPRIMVCCVKGFLFDQHGLLFVDFENESLGS